MFLPNCTGWRNLAFLALCTRLVLQAHKLLSVGLELPRLAQKWWASFLFSSEIAPFLFFRLTKDRLRDLSQNTCTQWVMLIAIWRRFFFPDTILSHKRDKPILTAALLSLHWLSFTCESRELASWTIVLCCSDEVKTPLSISACQKVDCPAQTQPLLLSSLELKAKPASLYLQLAFELQGPQNKIMETLAYSTNYPFVTQINFFWEDFATNNYKKITKILPFWDMTIIFST